MSADYYLQSRNIYKHLTCHLKEIIDQLSETNSRSIKLHEFLKYVTFKYY
jgi:hypothetical protein